MESWCFLCCLLQQTVELPVIWDVVSPMWRNGCVNRISLLLDWLCHMLVSQRTDVNRPISQIPQCIRDTSHNAPFFNRSMKMHLKMSSGKWRSFCLENRAFADCNSSLNSPMALKWCTKLVVVQKRWPIVFRGYSSNFKVTRDKNRRFWPELSVFRLLLQFELIDGFEMMDKA